MVSGHGRLRTILALASFALFMLAPRVEAAPVVSLGSATHVVGDTFTISVSVRGAADLQAFQFDLSYNDAILSVLGYTDAATAFDAAATAGGGVLTGLTGFSFAGLLSGVADSMSGASAGMTGDGVIVDIEFEAIAAGISTLTLSSVFLNFSDSGFDVANGEVCVNQAGATPCSNGAVPAPGTLALLALGLGLVTWFKERK